MARKKEGWLDFVKRFFRLDARSKTEQKERRKRWALENNQKRSLPPITEPPQGTVLREAEEVPSKSALNVAIVTAAAAEAALAAAEMAAEVLKLSAGVPFPQAAPDASQNNQEKNGSLPIQIDQEKCQRNYPPQAEKKVQDARDYKMRAAIKIQSAFRGYLARKALRALKGIVKLQAIIRGQAVRRQAMTTLKQLQSIVNINSQVCQTRSNVGERSWSNNENCQFEQSSRDNKHTVNKNNSRRWDDGLLSKDKEDAFVLSKKEAMIMRERVKEYVFSHRKSAESEHRIPSGRWRYWLEQWVDTQLNRSREFEDLDPVTYSKDKSGGRQLKPRSHLKNQQQHSQFEQSDSPMMIPRRYIRHRKQYSVGEETFPSSPSIPAYMAATESARAKARPLSSPKLRPGAFDTYSDSYSPYKNKLSLMSSIMSEVPTMNRSYKSGKLGGQLQRGQSLKGSSCNVKSGRVTRNLSLE
ncbi:hypothetical protein SAY86_009603 [Trapa natans]|uniref:DUF4005 domain-containing protein n=1 Tax=Trapa natans TaxID=22666 RepID=A0AAN7L1Z2_TRANT|nr:hypothetical protein SAY86_009603 [Trapa natans]